VATNGDVRLMLAAAHCSGGHPVAGSPHELVALRILLIDYPMMVVGIYATLGVLLLRASRDPMKHMSLIWFTVW